MDEDGDWVTIADSADLNFALESIRQRGVNTLKVRIGGAQCGMPDEIVTELKSIRDMSISVLGNCNKFLRKCTGITKSVPFLILNLEVRVAY